MANIIFPISDTRYSRDISFFLKVLCQNDIKLSRSWSLKKLGGYVNIVDVESQQRLREIDQTAKDHNEQEDDEDEQEIPENNIYTEIYDSYGRNINTNYKAYLLLRWVEDNGRSPKQSEVYQGVKIGSFWRTEKKKLDKR